MATMRVTTTQSTVTLRHMLPIISASTLGAAIGLAAPLLLSLLRFLQGIGLGGEWGGSVLLSLEHGDDRHRGFWASWPQTGVPIGLALSALVVLLFKVLYPGEAFGSIGWRMPFFLSSALV